MSTQTTLRQLAEAGKRKMGRRCMLSRAAASLSKQDRRELEELLADATISTPAIRLALAQRGAVVSETSLYNHRRRDCIECYGGRA